MIFANIYLCFSWYLIFYIFYSTSCATWGNVITAEEYFSIGMAYFDVGRYGEAEKWFNRAKSADKTKTASEYNLGRIAFETKRYDEAFTYFNRILAKDSHNVMALRAAAYTKIKMGDIEAAEALYDRVLALVPESADDGYNHALVLYAMEKYEMSEVVLSNYPFALLENNDVILLFARVQRAQHKPEAADRYARWLETNSDPAVRYEYALALEEAGFYARALEECRTALKDLTSTTREPKKSVLHYAVARLLLIADPENEEGITELKSAVAEGFEDMEALEALMTHKEISVSHKDEIRRIIDDATAVKKDREAKKDSLGKDAKADPSNGDNPNTEKDRTSA